MPLTNSSKMLKQVRKLYKHKHKKNKNDTETSVDNNDHNNNPNINTNDSQFYDNNCNIVSKSCENLYTEFTQNDNAVSSTSIRESQRLQTEIQTERTTSSQSRTTIETTELLQKNITETPTDTRKASKPRKLSLPDKEIRFDQITPTEYPKSNSTQNLKANKDTFSLRIHLFKKRKGKSRENNINKLRRKGSVPDSEKTKSHSETIPEFTSRRHSVPIYCPPDPSSKRLNDNFETSSRTSTNSLEALRENRRSVISKLDDYIKHVRKSIDEGNIASAPNRLCCAQLLRTVYLQREQQHRYESLKQQHARRQGKHHSLPDVHLSSKSASQSNSRSLQNFHDASFDSSSSDSPRLRTKFPYKTPEDSECSSICSSEYNTHHSKDFDSFTTVGSNQNSINNNFNADNGCSSEDDGDSTDNDYEKFYEKCHSKNSRRILAKNDRRKSMPLFPQACDIDIY